MALCASSPVLTRVLAACGASPSAPAADDGGNGGAGGGGGGDEPPVEPRPQKVLFVPGFMSELYTAVSEFEQNALNAALRHAARKYLNYDVYGPLGGLLYHVDVGDRVAALIDVDIIPDGGLVSFHTQMAAFTTDGIEFHDITEEESFDSAQSVTHNSVAITEYLETVTDSDVVIVSHSKGGLDTLHALITTPSLTAEDGPVVGWVALQAPFYGSPVASLAPAVADRLLIALGGGPAMTDLSPAEREAYMTDHAAAVARLTATIPIRSCYSTYGAGERPDWAAFALSVFDGSLVTRILDLIATNIANDPLHLLSALALSATQAIGLIDARIESTLGAALANIGLMDTTNVVMEAAGIPNDGLVPAESAVLPGSTEVDLNVEVAPGDHAAPVMITAPLKAFWSTSARDDITTRLVDQVAPAQP